jgi:site-specific DNA-cytosine methylase
MKKAFCVYLEQRWRRFMKKKIAVLSLFDGISILHLALKNIGFDIKTYYSSEIDSDAVSISKYHFPRTKYLGDIRNWEKWDINWTGIDIVAGGSPCQSFSIANQGNNYLKQGFEGKSNLIFEYLNVLSFVKSKNPKVKFLLENVKMQSKWRDKITSLIGVDPVLIDSKAFSPQHRERYYWCNWKVSPIKKESAIVIKDIVDKYSDKYFLSSAHHKAFMRSYNWKYCGLDEKGKTILATYYKQPPHTTYIPCLESPSGFRRLTPLECERMQTLPDDFTRFGIRDNSLCQISDTGRYRTVGNGWTYKVIEHIFSTAFMNKA